MRTYKLLFIIVLFVSQFAKSQEARLDLSHIDLSHQIWTAEQVYAMTEKFGIQDTFFLSFTQLKEKFKILQYIPQPDFDKYCQGIRDVGKSKNDFKGYFEEIMSINTINEWLSLLTKYPAVGKIYTDDPAFFDENSFTELVQKLKNREKLIFVKENGAILITENTRDNYHEFKHYTRLK